MNVNQLPAVIKQQIPNARYPVHYETACKELALCRTMEEAKLGDTAAEVLAVWAKVYKSEQAEVEAKRLKLHAYRRMCELADEARPAVAPGKRGAGGGGREPGTASYLRSHGFSKTESNNIRAVGAASREHFERALNSARPPAPVAFRHGRERVRSPQAAGGMLRSLRAFLGFCRQHEARAAAKFASREALIARDYAREISDWLDEFEQYLPKAGKVRK